MQIDQCKIAKCFRLSNSRDDADLQLPICNVHFALCNHPASHHDHATPPRKGPS
ncbi:hypothetical protein RESH_01763 [Rhodopirellula europaea SH398]|uniref:Uncharacterized protein n=1 Tax=Rhodopirellula europaea SH398 TaxID=1263868 RepID=M5S841_9BACT|nr:hypothetical protein RESH_01763 [Rhodopirellula europaea SH398]